MLHASIKTKSLEIIVEKLEILNESFIKLTVRENVPLAKQFL